MNFTLLYRRIWDIIVDPIGMWQNVNEEKREVNELRISFLLPLVLLISIAGVIGALAFSYNGLSILFPINIAIKYFLSFVLTVEVTARVVTEILLVFTPERNFNVNYKIIMYSFAPFMVSMIITRLFSSLIFLNLISIYGFFIAYLGIRILTGIHKSLRIRYTALISISTIVIYLAITFIINSIFDGLYDTFTRF